MAYTTKAKVEAFLNETITATLATEIAQATDLIEKKTDRKFEADSVASIRYYSGNGLKDLLIDECVEITKVEQGNNYYGDSFSEIGSTGLDNYSLYPKNYASMGVPIRAVYLRNRIWLVGRDNHKITAKWGYSLTVPSAIELATTILTAGIYSYNRGGASGELASENIGAYSVSYKTEEGFKALKQALQIIEQYRRVNI
jgi:hypothetical protein